MAYLNLSIVAGTDPDGKHGKIYNNTVTVAASTSSDVYKLPIDCQKSVGVSWDSGTPTIYFTFSSHATIDAGDAQWVEWDLSSLINPAVTGVYITNSGGAPIVLEITSRTV